MRLILLSEWLALSQVALQKLKLQLYIHHDDNVIRGMILFPLEALWGSTQRR